MTSEKISRVDKSSLAELCTRCLILTQELRSTSDYGDPEILRERIKNILSDFENECEHAGITSENIQKAKFAQVAFIDEIILTSQWSQKDYWVANPLQIELYGRYGAGEEFYEYLDHFGDNADLMEVYYTCLGLGFKGRYQFNEQEKLQSLINKTHAELRVASKKTPKPLAPHGARRDEIKEKIRKNIPVWMIASFAAIISLIIYFIMSYFVSTRADAVLKLIDQIL